MTDEPVNLDEHHRAGNLIQPVPAAAGRSIVGDRGNKFETGAFQQSRQLAPVIDNPIRTVALG